MENEQRDIEVTISEKIIREMMKECQELTGGDIRKAQLLTHLLTDWVKWFDEMPTGK